MVAAQKVRDLVREEMSPGADGRDRFAALCASVVHEISQPIAAIVANAGACQARLAGATPDYDRIAANVARISKSAVSVLEIIEAMRALFLQQDGTLHVGQINDTITEVSSLLASEIAERPADITLELDPNIGPMLFVPLQIRLLLINLIRNGIEAMGGTSWPGHLIIRSTSLDDGARVDIFDRGSGISNVERMFEALFTTKTEGMGLGLAICRLIADAHGGRLWAEPVTPHGTCVSFFLPVVRTKPAKLLS